MAVLQVLLGSSSVWAQTCTVPDIVGQQQVAAVSAVTAAGLVVGKVTMNYARSETVGEVVWQAPAPGIVQSCSDGVAMTVSGGDTALQYGHSVFQMVWTSLLTAFGVGWGFGMFVKMINRS